MNQSPLEGINRTEGRRVEERESDDMYLVSSLHSFRPFEGDAHARLDKLHIRPGEMSCGMKLCV